MVSKETAYHEAGHLVAGLFFNLKPIEATIIPDETLLGSVSHINRLRPDYTQEEKLNAWLSRTKLKRVLIFDPHDLNEQRQKRVGKKKIISLLSGYVAQKRYNNTEDGADNDFNRALQITEICFRLPKKYVDDENFSQGYADYLMGRFMPQTERFINNHWREITHIAKLLYKNGNLSEKEIDNLHQTLKQMKNG